MHLATDELICGTAMQRAGGVQSLGAVLQKLLQQRGVVPVRQPFPTDSSVPAIQTAMPQPRMNCLNDCEGAKSFSLRKRFARA